MRGGDVWLIHGACGRDKLATIGGSYLSTAKPYCRVRIQMFPWNPHHGQVKADEVPNYPAHRWTRTRMLPTSVTKTPTKRGDGNTGPLIPTFVEFSKNFRHHASVLPGMEAMPHACNSKCARERSRRWMPEERGRLPRCHERKPMSGPNSDGQ